MYDIASERMRSYYCDLEWGGQVNLFTALWLIEMEIDYTPVALRNLLLNPDSPMQLQKTPVKPGQLPRDELMVIPQLMSIAQKFRDDGYFKLVPKTKGNYVAYTKTALGSDTYYEWMERRVQLAIESPETPAQTICGILESKFQSEYQRRKNQWNPEDLLLSRSSDSSLLLQNHWLSSLTSGVQSACERTALADVWDSAAQNQLA